ncbi:MAG TPA: hypothetical protein VJ810_17910 [Blastocatellia bacterium]|nr:hypothetical protein [Blastocatellia bacterium]
MAILPRGEAIRNFVYSGALDEVARELSVTLLTVIPDEEYLESIGNGRFDLVIELASRHDHRLLNLLREQLDISHGRYLWSVAARERWRRRDYEANTPVRKLKRATKKLLAYPFANRAGVELLSKVEQTASRAFRSTDEELNLLRELNPSLVFNGSHVHSRNSIRVIHAARQLGVPTAAFIFSWDNLTSQGRIIPPYDYYLVWNEAIRDQLLKIYPAVQADQVFVTGTPQFDFHFRPEFFWAREEFCAKAGADPSRPIVLYTTGMDNHMPDEASVIEGVYESLRRMTRLGPPQLMVRLYPKDRRPERFDDLRRRRPEILFPHIPWNKKWLTPRLEDSYLLTNMLRHSALGVNIASTVSLELAMFDKPVINIGYNPPKAPGAEGLDSGPIDFATYYDFDHYRPLVQSGAVGVAWTEDEMRRLLIEGLTEPHKDSHKRREFVRTMFGDSLDGKSGARVAQTLLRLCGRANILR